MNLSIPQKRSRTMINFIHNTVYKLKPEQTSGSIHRLGGLVLWNILSLLSLFFAKWEILFRSKDDCPEDSFRYGCLVYPCGSFHLCTAVGGSISAMVQTVKPKNIFFVFYRLFSAKNKSGVFIESVSLSNVSSFYRHNLF